MMRVPESRALATTAAALGILFLTLMPSGSAPPLPFSYDLGEGRRWLADGILNVLLFIPLGLALGWNSRSTWIAVLSGLILSTAVEIAQTIVPGRDPALSDIVFNTLGTMVGALLARRPYAWLSPDPKRSAILASIAVVVVAAVMSATVLLLSPQGPASVARSGNDLLLQYPTSAEALGLDEPEYWYRDAFQGARGANTAEVVGLRERNHWRVTIGPSQHAVLGPTVGQGWTLLAYPNAIGRRWGPTLNAAWVFVLCLPIGFWARGRYQIPVAALVIGLLLLVPAIAGAGPTSYRDWIGATLGFLVGTSFGATVWRIRASSPTHRSIR